MESCPYTGYVFAKTPVKLQWMFHHIAEAHQEENGFRGKHFAYIPLHLSHFLDLIKPHLKPNIHIVDVGCGAGDKLYELHLQEPSLRLTGIEYDDVLARCAKRICGSFANIIHGNALEQDYSHYDLIYFYRPIAHDDLQSDLQIRIMKTMRRRAILQTALYQYENTRTKKPFPQLNVGCVKR